MKKIAATRNYRMTKLGNSEDLPPETGGSLSPEDIEAKRIALISSLTASIKIMTLTQLQYLDDEVATVEATIS